MTDLSIFDYNKDPKVNWEKFDAKKYLVRDPSALEKIPFISAEEKLCQLYNVWMGTANVDITHTIVEEMEKLPGVEIIDVWSRYTFRIAVGKLFPANEVLSSIEDKIYEIATGSSQSSS